MTGNEPPQNNMHLSSSLPTDLVDKDIPWKDGIIDEAKQYQSEPVCFIVCIKIASNSAQFIILLKTDYDYFKFCKSTKVLQYIS